MPDAEIVAVTGDVDLAAKIEFSDVLETAVRSASKKLVVSLLSCDYFDSTGLAVLIAARKQSSKPFIVVVRPQTFLSRLFATTGLVGLLNVVGSIDEALALKAVG